MVTGGAFCDTGPATALIYLHNITRQQGPEVGIERRAGGLTLTASLWLQWLRTYYAYRTGPGSFNGTSYAAADLARGELIARESTAQLFSLADRSAKHMPLEANQ